MSGVRRAWLDASPGERRGVVTLDGRPERLVIERDGLDGEPAAAPVRLDERWRVRIGARSPDRRAAFVDLGTGGTALIRLPKDAPAPESALALADVISERRADKAAVLRWTAQAGEGAPGLVEPAPDLRARLAAWTGSSAVEEGDAAREIADAAEEAALAESHDIGDGLTLTIERTRALVAVDLDWARGGEASAHRRLAANLAGLQQLARLLRLKALGGTVAVDLIGFPRDGRLIQAARDAFAAGGGEATILGPNQLGVMMLSLPHGRQPVAETLCDGTGKLSARSLAQAAVRDMEREGRAAPGRLIAAHCPPAVALPLRQLAARLGPRFIVREEVGFPLGRRDIRPL